MKAVSLGALLVALIASSTFAAPQTWTGTISDSMCGAKHMEGEHGMKVSDKECTEMCVKKGAKYVLVSDGKVLAIANQDFKGLAQLKGDAVTITKIDRATKGAN